MLQITQESFGVVTIINLNNNNISVEESNDSGRKPLHCCWKNLYNCVEIVTKGAPTQKRLVPFVFVFHLGNNPFLYNGLTQTFPNLMFFWLCKPERFGLGHSGKLWNRLYLDNISFIAAELCFTIAILN